MNDDVAIKVTNVSKSFVLPHDKQNSIKGGFISIVKGGKRTYEKQEVLKDVSFEIKKGEFFGIVGRNGSGKSTLLKMLAGIYTPTAGSIQVNGSLTPFIELGVGFNPELTGRENVYLNGALLGFNRKQMDAMYDDIIEFAELERFMDQKLKNYSSGMQVRLAFSIAIRARSDILLLDEVLAVGDENFQRKCYSYFAQLKRNKQTVIFVSHDMSAVRDYCTSGVLIDNGELVAKGNIPEIINEYTSLNMSRIEVGIDKDNAKDEEVRRWGNGKAEIEKVYTTLDGTPKNVYSHQNNLEVNITIKANEDISRPVIGMQLQDEQGRVVFASNTNELEIKLEDIKNGATVTAKFLIDNVYTNGKYSVSCAIANTDRSEVYSRVEDAVIFGVSGRSSAMQHSIVHPKHEFILDR